MNEEPTTKKKPRGFAAISPERQREIAAMGGRKAHANGTAHTFTADEAKAAGKKGGASVAKDREHMAEIGRVGGKQRGQNLARPSAETEAPNE